MSEWVRLGDVCSLQNGFAFDSRKFIEDNSVGLPLIRVRDVVRGYSETFTPEESDLKYIINNGDFLIGMDGEFNLGVWNGGKALLNQRVCKISSNSDKLDMKYLSYILPSCLKKIEQKTSYSTVKHISSKQINNIEISLPTISEQQHIVSVLDTVNSLIDARKKQIALLDEAEKSLFVEMFGDPVENPKGWDKCKLESCITSPQNGLYKPASKYYDNDIDGVPILRIDAFYNGKVTDFSALKRLECTDHEIDLYLLHENDIVINRVNSLPYLGKCALIQNLIENTVFESNMMRFKTINTRLDSVFLVRLLCTKYIKNQILSHAKKAVNQASINQKDVKDLEIYLPSLELQQLFAARISSIEKRRCEMERGLQQMEEARSALMQKYFG